MNKEKLKTIIMIGIFALIGLGTAVAVTNTWGDNVAVAGWLTALGDINGSRFFGDGSGLTGVSSIDYYDCVYASDGTGTTTNLQTCFNSGGRIYIKTDVDTAITYNVTQDNTTIDFAAGADIEYTGTGTGLYIAPTTTTPTHTFTVSEDLSIGETEITLNDTTGLAEKDYIKIYSNQPFWGTPENQGELNQIVSISGNDIVLSWGLVMDYDSDYSLNVSKENTIKNIEINNPSIRCHTQGSLNRGLYIDNGINAVVNNVYIENCSSAGVYLRSNLFTTVNGGYVMNVNESGTGYGIKVAHATMFSTFNDITVIDSLKCADCGGTSAGGVPFHNNFIDINCLHPEEYGLFCHDSCGQITYTGGHIMGNDSTSQARGVQMTCPYFNVENLEISTFKHGIYVGDSNNDTYEHGVFKDIDIINPDRGITIQYAVFNDILTFDNVNVIQGQYCIDINYNASNIWFRNSYYNCTGQVWEGSDTGGTRVNHIKFSGNTISAPADSPVYINYDNAHVYDISFIDNNFYTNRYGVRARADVEDWDEFMYSNNRHYCLDGACSEMLYLQENGGQISYVTMLGNRAFGGFTGNYSAAGVSNFQAGFNYYR